MAQVIEGEWDELLKRNDLHGRKVRITILDEEHREALETDQWLKAFHAWVNRPRPVTGPIDDSRDSIYSGTMDDPR
jgi:hypothetical protein